MEPHPGSVLLTNRIDLLDSLAPYGPSISGASAYRQTDNEQTGGAPHPLIMSQRKAIYGIMVQSKNSDFVLLSLISGY